MSIEVYGADVEFMKFSAGEPHVKVTNIENDVEVYWKFENFEEFMYVALIFDVVSKKASATRLDLPYLPFARQDRATTPEQPFSLDVFCKMLSTLKVKQIILSDVHSDVVFDLMKDSDILVVSDSQYQCFNMTCRFESCLKNNKLNYDCIISPDSGAKNKTIRIGKSFNKPVVCATKVRDPLTGQLSSPTIDFGDLKPKRALIPDDICDGGYTFIQLADVIKQQFPEIVLDLYVTHGIFSRGKDELNKRFDKIYVYNDMSKEKTQ